MTSTHRRPRLLTAALAVSLMLHTLPFVPDFLGTQAARRPEASPAPLQARLQPPPAMPAPDVPLTLPEQPGPERAEKPAARPLPAAKPTPAPARNWTSEIRRQLKELDRRGLFYPPEAVARGLEGTVVVLLVLDEAGNVVAARVETGSGHRILDEAALQAVRSLRALPADAPRETELPVRFRLR